MPFCNKNQGDECVYLCPNIVPCPVHDSKAFTRDANERQGRHAWLEHLDDELDGAAESDALDASIRGVTW